MTKKFIYTPGPTTVRENVRLERAVSTTNPDMDLDFVENYKKICDNIGTIINTKNPVYILAGEGILGLEAACASLTEEGDRVLVIDNGIFGNGFKDFVQMYGGDAVLFTDSYTNAIDYNKLDDFLRKDHNFKYATIVHCDTPTGVLNDLSKICRLLNEYGIITVVDSVAAMGGEALNVDDWKIDIALGGSQKAFSAPAGLTMLSISDRAKYAMENRKSNITGFYCNLNIWKSYYEDKWFPYTMPISDIMALGVAAHNILDEGVDAVIDRHSKIANATRKACVSFGLELFLEGGFSNTVTAVKIPEGIGAIKVKKHLNDKYNAIMVTSLKPFEDKILRIGHMGENAREDCTIYALNLIQNALEDLGFKGKGSLVELFIKNL